MSLRTSVAIFFALAVANRVGADPINEVIEKITAARNKIDSYHLIIVQEHATPSRKEAPATFRKHRLEIWRRGDKTRIDSVVIESTDRDEPAGERTVRCRNCEKPGSILQASYRVGSMTPIEFNPIESFSKATDATDCNWPWVGLDNNIVWPWFAFSQDRFLRSFLIQDDPRILQIVETVGSSGGTDCQLFSRSSKDGMAKVSVWIDPKRDLSPIRLEKSNGGKVVLETDFTYPAKPTDRIWFPETIEQHLGGKAGTSNVYRFELVELNRKIPDSVFQYGGLGLHDDLPVMVDGITDVMRAPRLRDGKLVYPDDGKTKPSGDLPSPLSAVPDRPPSSWWAKLPYLAGAFVLAVLGAILVRRTLRRKG